jgi:hypothetical protein
MGARLGCALPHSPPPPPIPRHPHPTLHRPQELPGAPATAPGARRLGAAPAGPAQQHYAELFSSGGASSGCGGGLLAAPWTLSRLAALLAEAEGEFEVFTDAEPTSAGLNPAPGADAPWQVAPPGGAAESAAWADGCRALGGRYVRQLRFASGAFDAKLGAP